MNHREELIDDLAVQTWMKVYGGTLFKNHIMKDERQAVEIVVDILAEGIRNKENFALDLLELVLSDIGGQTFFQPFEQIKELLNETK